MSSYNNPFFPETIHRLIDALWFPQEPLLLEVGCGHGALLKKLLSTFGGKVEGVEIDPKAVQAAKERLSDALERVHFHQKPFLECGFSENSFDGCFSLGATHAFGDTGEALDQAFLQLKQLTKPGGLIVLGDGYWKEPPPEAYIEATGLSPDELRSHQENIALASKHGLELVYAIRASEAEWDHFEGSFWMKAERERLQDPEDEQKQQKADRIRKWRDAYLKWGCETMGFALYVFVVPG